MNNRTYNYYLGLLAEHLAILFYTLGGYWLLKHRFKTPLGELDLIFIKGRQLFFVEVKFRSSDYDDVLCTTSQQRRLVRAAEIFLLQSPKYREFAIQFDFILIKPWHWPRKVANFIN